MQTKSFKENFAEEIKNCVNMNFTQLTNSCVALKEKKINN